MSIVNSDLVSDSLREIGVLDETETASAEQFADAIRKLNQMMEMWEIGGVKLDYFPQSIPSDTCPIPAYAEMGVTSSLSIVLAPVYRASVTQELVAKTQTALAVIIREVVKRGLPVPQMWNRPLGEGDRGRNRFANILYDTP